MDPWDAHMYAGPLPGCPVDTHAHLMPVANEAHQTVCVSRALLDVFRQVDAFLLDALRSTTAWQGTGIPPAQRSSWLHCTVPHVAARVLAPSPSLRRTTPLDLAFG